MTPIGEDNLLLGEIERLVDDRYPRKNACVIVLGMVTNLQNGTTYMSVHDQVTHFLKLRSVVFEDRS